MTPSGAPTPAAAQCRTRSRAALRRTLYSRLLITLALAGALALGWHGLAARSASAAEATAAAPAAPPGTFPLTDQQLRSMQIEPVRAVSFHSQEVTEGKIAYDGDTLTPVFSPYSGHVIRLIAPLGAHVAKGAPLFTLDASEFAQAESDLVTAASQVKLNGLTEQRKHAQYLAHGASMQDWQQAQNDLAASQSALAAVRNRLRILGQSDAQIDAIIAAGTRMDAQVAALAPISGWVVGRRIGPGQYLQAGDANPVYTVADLSSVWLVADVPEAEAGSVRVGQRVSAQLLALPGRELEGRLNYVAAAVDPATRRLTVHAQIANPDGALKPEMFATVTIVTSADSMAPAVPAEAVIYEGEQARVWILRDAHDAALRTITLGRTAGDDIEVLTGLNTGEQVITRGALFIDRAASGG